MIFSFKKNRCPWANFFFIFYHFLLKHKIEKLLFLFRFSYFSSKPNLEITTMTEKSIGVTIKIPRTQNQSSHWMKIKHTTLVWIHRGSKCSFQFSSSMKIKNWKTDKNLPAGGGTRCVYLSSIWFSSNDENWNLKSISVHLDWFHLK